MTVKLLSYKIWTFVSLYQMVCSCGFEDLNFFQALFTKDRCSHQTGKETASKGVHDRSITTRPWLKESLSLLIANVLFFTQKGECAVNSNLNMSPNMLTILVAIVHTQKHLLLRFPLLAPSL